jgi:hypothetical protein
MNQGAESGQGEADGEVVEKQSSPDSGSLVADDAKSGPALYATSTERS